jgi:hypothetical protein
MSAGAWHWACQCVLRRPAWLPYAVASAPLTVLVWGLDLRVKGGFRG